MDYVPEKQAVYIRLTVAELDDLLAAIVLAVTPVEVIMPNVPTADDERQVVTLLDLRERLDAVRRALTRDTGVWP